jgi:hypothetical protein
LAAKTEFSDNYLMKRISSPSSSKSPSAPSVLGASDDQELAGPSRGSDENKRKRENALSTLPERQPGSPAARFSHLSSSPRSGPASSSSPSSSSSSDFSTPPRETLDKRFNFTAKLPPGERRSQAARFFEKALGQPELASLISQFASRFEHQWRITGSVALRLHSLHRGAGPGREPDDVDVTIEEPRFMKVFNALNSPTNTGALKRALNQNGEQETYFLFDKKLKVDLITVKKTKRVHVHSFVNICGVPVVTLSALRKTKENNLGELGDTHLKTREKAKRDLETITKLESMQPIENFGDEYKID